MRLQVIKNVLTKGILWGSLLLLLLFFTVTSFLRLPSVQTRIIQDLTGNLDSLTGFHFEIAYINLNWFDVVKLEGVRVYDTHDTLMFYIPEGKIDFQISSVLDGTHRTLDKVSVTNAEVKLNKYVDSEPINITLFIDTLKARLAGDKRVPFSIDAIAISNGTLHFHNYTNTTTYPGFDLNRFTIDQLTGEAFDFSVNTDTVHFTTPGLSGIERKTQLPIHKLQTDFTVHQREMTFGNLEAQIGNSVVKDSLAFTYSRMSNLSYFVDSVQMHISLDQSRIDTRDLMFFSKEFRGIRDVFELSGNFNGGVKNFTVRQADISFGERGRIRGSIGLDGLPNLNETFISIRLQNSRANNQDLQPYLGSKIFESFNGINSYTFSGNFTGFLTDFVAFGNFETNLGKLTTDVNIKVDNNKIQYIGKLTTKDFDLGQYAGLDFLQQIDMSGEIRGQGLQVNDADFELNGRITRIGVNGYDINDIRTDARFTAEIFEGDVSINDPNVQLQATGSINLRDRADLVNMNVQIDTIDFQTLNLTEVPASMRGIVDVDVVGLEFDKLDGQINLSDIRVTYDTGYLELDKLEILSKRGDQDHSLDVRNDYFEAKLRGSYQYTWLYEDFTRLYREYLLNIENNASALKEYYASERPNNKREYYMDMDLQLTAFNPIVQLFKPNYSISDSVSIVGSFSNGYTSIIQLNAQFDTLQIDDFVFADNYIDVNASKIADSTNILSSIFVSSEDQLLSNAQTQGLIAETIWDRNVIDFNLMISQASIDSYADLYGKVVFENDTTQIQLAASDLQLLNEKWNVIEDNKLSIAGSEITFQQIGFAKNEEELILNGSLSKAPDKELQLDLNNFRVANFNPLLQRPIEGTSNGFFRLKDYYNDRVFETDVRIDSLSVGGFGIGDLQNKSIWDNAEQKFDLLFEIEREKKKVVDINGAYYPGQDQGLYLSADLRDANVNFIEPFVSNYFSEFRGRANGTFTITGDLNQPLFKGTGTVTDGGMKINYLNTSYAFTTELSMEGNEIALNNAIINDKNGQQASLSGLFRIEDVSNIFLQFDGNFDNFLVLNTSLADNELFYGNALGTGTFSISGYTSSIEIAVDATTAAGSRMFIPLGGTGDVITEEYIHFVSFGTSETDESELERTLRPLEGLDFKLNLDVTRDAYIELIFDLTAGDIIRGRGNGQLNFHFDRQGEFTMVGDYTIEEGGYNFTMYNIVNKEFNILPNSTITWLGDPYAGNLNIHASYDLLASIGPLLDTAYRNAPEIRRRYDSRVLLEIDGPLLSPNISFQIEVDDYPNSFSYQGAIVNLDTEMSAVQSLWQVNEQELQKQVFSLIVMRQFAEKNINTGGSIGRSVSEFVSNQLSYWISQVDENLEINLELGALSPEALNTFQMRLSYTFMEGRLRVTRDGGFTDPENQTNVASIIGDWSVEYMLSENGNLRVKLFQETNYNTLSQSNANDYMAIQGGVSILYTQSYDEISEIFKSARNQSSSSE